MIRVFSHYLSGRKLGFFLAESSAIAVLCLAGASMLALTLARPAGGRPQDLLPALPMLAALALAAVAVLQFTLYALDLYDLRVATDDRRLGVRVLRAGGVAALVLGAVMAATAAQLPRGAVLGGALGALIGSLLSRLALPRLMGGPRRVLIVGNGVRALRVSHAIADQGDHFLEVCGLIEPRREGTAATVGEPLPEAAARLGADYVVVACDEPRGAVGAEALLACRMAGRGVYDAGAFCERVLRKLPVAYLRASDLAYSDDLSLSRARDLFKRLFNLVVASALLVCSAAPMVLVALSIKLDSEGPVLYRQERVGRRGKVYGLWKFRSMRTDAEKNGAVWAEENDDRVTRVGRFIRKTRMDEIPQVFNVLRGDMSFVGPRPERPVFVEQLKEQIPFFALREVVKPGITGWAQIRYPYGASVEDARNKLKYDLYYVKNGSLFLDVGIIFHTVRHVLLGRGAR